MGKILHNLKSSVFPLFFVVLSLFTLLLVYYTNPPQYRQNNYSENQPKIGARNAYLLWQIIIGLEWIAYGYVEGIGFFERRHVEITAFSGFVWRMKCIAHVGSQHEHIHIKSYAKPCA